MSHLDKNRHYDSGHTQRHRHFTHGPAILLLHQFAKALLCLEEEGPSECRCMCNQIRARYNAPPADHDQPTNLLDAKSLHQVFSGRGQTGHPQLHKHSGPADFTPDFCHR